MRTALSLAASLLLAACASEPPIKNDRPPGPMSRASSLVAQCQVTVRFNTDERSVKESEYLDSFFCLGVMEGIMGMNFHVKSPVFCLPPEGLKNWLAAKAVVDHAQAHPEQLDVPETEFAIEALKSTFPCKAPQEKSRSRSREEA